MAIKVKTISNHTLEIPINNIKKVLELKEMIEMQEGVPSAIQRLIYNGKHLIDDHNLNDVGIIDGKTIHMVLALRAGSI